MNTKRYYLRFMVWLKWRLSQFSFFFNIFNFPRKHNDISWLICSSVIIVLFVVKYDIWSFRSSILRTVHTICLKYDLLTLNSLLNVWNTLIFSSLFVDSPFLVRSLRIGCCEKFSSKIPLCKLEAPNPRIQFHKLNCEKLFFPGYF